MKKHYAILIVFILALNPILASATASDADENPQPAQVNNSENAPITQSNDVPTEPEPVIDNPIPAPENNNNDVPEIPKVDNVSDTPNPKDEPKVELPDESDVEKDVKDDSEDKENDEQTDVKDAAEDDKAEEDDASITEESEEDDQNVHVHTFKYTGNKDGTHTVTCTEMIEPDEDSEDEAATECTYEEIEPCEYGEDDICIFCGDKKPDEEEEFAPSISFSISNQSFSLGGPNPVISVNISQDDYDIEYAQVCFANYGENKFINVGLAQGKYFDFITDEFVYTSNDCWCASPDITTDYSSGTYSLRSIYVRSTTGESIHYSIESDSLPEEYQNIDISLNMDAVQSDFSNIIDKPLIDIPAFYDDSEDDETMDIPESVPEVIPDISEDEPQNDIEDYPIPSEPSSPETHEETNAEPIQEENIEDESEKLIEEPLLEEPAITKANDNENNDNSQSIIKDTITETIVAEEEQTPISSDSTEAANVDNENAKEETAQAEETPHTANDDQQSSITQFFNSIFKFVKKLFKWW
ncbi:hypothetical protein SAMN04487830_11465 [Pseudobutyrivibrio sp. OR37]|uniref:hypothetical protein n=1 Tax=Pseudobutyrivibrio sp. OR37 TaxID=1798186 RepID=UPI0008E4EBAB|nr:hypothetical protein [Pseudobutyrivibrio sp. OR37]SFH96178.1 hypothetical protein SAMN04487830_11465 [Pseudobutyrivibrio sp. OR37]